MITSTLYGYEEGTDRTFRNVGTISSDAGRSPKRHNTAFNTRRNFEIKMWKLGRPRRRWEDNINMDIREVGGGCGDWVELAQDRDGWRALVSTVMNFLAP